MYSMSTSSSRIHYDSHLNINVSVNESNKMVVIFVLKLVVRLSDFGW